MGENDDTRKQRPTRTWRASQLIQVTNERDAISFGIERCRFLRSEPILRGVDAIRNEYLPTSGSGSLVREKPAERGRKFVIVDVLFITTILKNKNVNTAQS